MNKEYYQAKADLCRDLFIKQVSDNQIEVIGVALIVGKKH